VPTILTNVPLLLVWAAVRDRSKVGRIRTVCGHAPDQSDPSGDRQGEQERYISENGVFAQFTPELVDPLVVTHRTERAADFSEQMKETLDIIRNTVVYSTSDRS
jgi:hypothetical protein